MKLIATLVLSISLPVASVAESPPQGQDAATQRQNWDLMVGDWSMVGTAKDSPKGPDYAVAWTLHGTHILNGLFVQVDQVWKGNGAESRTREIVSYDPVTRTHSTHGFSDDGSSWVGKGTYDGHTLVEEGATTGSSGKVSRWRDTYVYGPDWMTVTGTEEVEQDGVKWTSFSVKGTKAASSQ
jgi:hypothetical protein